MKGPQARVVWARVRRRRRGLAKGVGSRRPGQEQISRRAARPKALSADVSSATKARKVCIVTGANSGIGLFTSVELAKRDIKVVLVCRDQRKGEKAAEEVKRKSGGKNAELMLCDLASLKSVRAFAEEFQKTHDSLHILVNNAGIANIMRRETVDGYEATWEVNYLSPFLLTDLLLGLMKKSAPSRIVNVTSVANFSGNIEFDDLQMKNDYSVMRAYSRSKLALVLFTYELARRLEGTGVTANCLHPGSVATNIWGRPLGAASFLGKVGRVFMTSPEEGAKTSVYLASAPEVEGVTGKYYDQIVEKRSAAASYDEALAARLWETTLGLVGLTAKSPAGPRSAA